MLIGANGGCQLNVQCIGAGSVAGKDVDACAFRRSHSIVSLNRDHACYDVSSETVGGRKSMKNVWRALRRLPLLVGAGALFSYGARASVPHGLDDKADLDGAARHRGAEVLLKLENDNVYFSENAGRSFQELELAATPEAKRLKRLLQQQQGAVSSGQSRMKVSPMLVADGAGGLQWARPKSATAPGNFDGAQQVTTRTRSATTDNPRPHAAPTVRAQAKPE
jgi:hypothetical protein